MAPSSYYAEFINPAVDRLVHQLRTYPGLDPDDTRAMYAEDAAVAVFQSRAWPSLDQTLGEGSGVVAHLEDVQHQPEVYLYNESNPSEGLIIHAIRPEPEFHRPYGSERVSVSQAADQLGIQTEQLETLAPLLGAARMDARRAYAEFPRLNITYGAANAHGPDKVLAHERAGANRSAYDPRHGAVQPGAVGPKAW